MPHLASELNDRLGLGEGSFNLQSSMQEILTFDISPLQKALVALAAKVDQCQKENATLRGELAELKISKRLEALEQGLQELADSQQHVPHNYFGAEGGGGYASADTSATFAGALAAATASTTGYSLTPGSLALGLNGPSMGSVPAAVSAGELQESSSIDKRSLSPALAAAGVGPGSRSGTLAGAGVAVASFAGGAGPAGSFSSHGGPGPGSPGVFGGFSRLGGGGGRSASMLVTPSLAAQGAGSPGLTHIGGADVGGGGSWVMYEMAQLKDRLGSMERKAETLWHAQEDDEQLRAAVERLRHDVVTVQAGVEQAQNLAASATTLAEKQAALTAEGASHVKEINDRVHALELQGLKSTDERREMTHKYENTVSQIWDQLRHVESSLSQRLTIAETSHVAAMQEVEEAKDGTSEVLQRVDDLKRHASALESKLESFNTQVAAAISPLHNSLAAAQERLEALSSTKQDAVSAVKAADVEVAVARAIDYADRRGDNLLKAMAGVEGRLEELADAVPNKGEVVLTVDLEALLTEHAHELDGHLDRLKGDMLQAVSQKVDREELGALEGRLGGRLTGLEGAILKGLKAISDKVSAALAEKLDMLKFSEFKLQVRAILADVEDKLRDWSPAALGTKASLSMGSTGEISGAPSCLCCDTRVRTVRDLKAMGFREEDRVFSPEKLPSTDPLLPNIGVSRNPTIGAHHNARLAGRQAAADARLRSTTNSVMETLPAGGGGGGGAAAPGSPSAGGGQGGGGLVGSSSSSFGQLGATGTSVAASLAMVDPSAYATLPQVETPTQRLQSAGAAKHAAGWGVKVEVETVSGMIGKGHLPSGRNNNNNNSKAAQHSAAGQGGQRATRNPVAAAAAASGLSVMMMGTPAGSGAAVAAAAAAAAAQSLNPSSSPSPAPAHGREGSPPSASSAPHGGPGLVPEVSLGRPMSPWSADLMTSPSQDLGPPGVEVA